jgi:hypothetical protein
MFHPANVLQFNTHALPLQFLKLNLHSYAPLIALCTGPKIFRNIFLSKVISVFLADFFMNHVSALKVTTLCITVLYGINLVVVDILIFIHIFYI